MNTWYTTNKAAIDSASLAASTQVASWAMYIDIATVLSSTTLNGPPIVLTSDSKCEADDSATNNDSTAVPAAAVTSGAVGSFGDVWVL